MIRAVLDVNVLISSILGPLGLPRQILLAWADNRFNAITSEGIIAELAVKLALPRIAERYNLRGTEDGGWVERLLRTQAEVFDLSGDAQALKFPNASFETATSSLPSSPQ